MTHDHHALVCAACGTLVPIAKRGAARWATGAAAAAIGAAKARSIPGFLLILGAGLLAGLIIDEMAKPACGQCSGPLRA